MSTPFGFLLFLVYVFFSWTFFWRRCDMLVQVEKSKVYIVMAPNSYIVIHIQVF
uniref:Uncharacterized protein n=1 Tax=Arundo donax TaxID=35708 RepID=A0A0A9HCC0_ARUDO